ncbi:hypothetical protein [Limnobacter sp.]|uniref:hypothetical protein n=1 Tax=Limnobacter sp. TaxID=2003368 RepID=UPI0025C38F51|nr:hypothetical protein [Limnobacter sp.]
MSQAQIKELEDLLITMERAGAPANEMRFVLAELDSLVETPETPAARKPRGRGEIAQAKKQEAIDNVSQQARIDPVGTFSAISQGVNKGIFNLLDLPGDIVNLAISEVNRQAGGSYIPPQMNVTDAVDLATEWLTGTPVVTAAEAPIAEIDTAFERILSKGAEYATEGAVGAALVGPRLAKAGATMLGGRPVAPAAAEGLLGASAGTGAGVAREIAPESAAGELVGALVGGFTPSAANKLKEVVVKQAEDAYLPLTEAGVYRRTAETIQEVAADPETAISNIERNRLILEDAGIDPSTVTTAQLVEDPALSATLKALSSDYNAVNNAIARGRADNTQLIVTSLKKEIPQSKTGVDVVTSANKYVTSAVNDLNDQIDLARNELDRLQGEGRDFATDEESLKFVAATQEAYEAAKKTENEMWSAVGKKEPLDLQPLKASIAKLERSARKEAIPDAQVPSGIYKQRAKMGTKKVDGKTVQLRNDFGFLSGYRSSVLQEMRAARAARESNKLRLLSEVEKEIAKFIDKAGSKDAYRAASAYTRSIRDNFNKGTIGKLLQVNVDQEARLAPEAALETIIKKGGKGAAEAERVQRLATGETPTGVELPAAPATAEVTMEALRDKFYGTARKESFFKNYGPMLRQFPGLSTELKTVSDAIETVAQEIASKEGRVASLTDKNKVSVAALLNADPENIYPVVSGMTRDDIRRLNQVVKVDGVEEGLQAVVLEEFLNKLRTRTASDWAEGFKSLDFVIETDLGFKKLFEEVLTPAQQASLRRLDKIAEISFKDPTKGFTDKEAAEIAASPFVEGLASMLALNITAKFTSGAGALAVANRSSKAARDVLSKLTGTQSQRLIEQALLDPDVLIGLLKIQTKAKTPEAAANQVRAYLLTAGVDVGQEAEKAPEVTEEPVVRNVPMGGQGSRQQRQAGMLTGQ